MMSASASGNVMNIWNTTDARELGVRFLASNKDDVAAKGKAFADYDVAISQGAGAKIGNVNIAIREGDDKIMVYGHTLPHFNHFNDITWLRFPLMIVGIFIVFAYNYWYNGKKKARGRGNPFEMGGMGGGLGGGLGGGMGGSLGGGMGGGMGGLSRSDMDSLKKLEGVEGFNMAEFERFVGNKGGGFGAGERRAMPGRDGPRFGPGARFGRR